MTRITLTLNDKQVTEEVEARLSLADLIRERFRLTGTHLGCEQGACGSCTVLVNDIPVRSCITLAIACEGMEVRTIEGFDNDPGMKVISKAFHQGHGLQCGYCTPGMLISVRDILTRHPKIDREALRVELSGNYCRCTGYQGILRSVEMAQAELNDGEIKNSKGSP